MNVMGIAREIRPLSVALIVAAVAAAGCGSSDDGDATVSDRPASDGGGQAAPAGGSADERAIRAVYAEMGAAYYADDAEAFCAVLTKSAQQELASVAQKPSTCVEHVNVLIEANKTGRPGDGKPSIVKLKVEGDRARALVKTERSLSYPVEFVKDGGTWKVNDTGEGR